MHAETNATMEINTKDKTCVRAHTAFRKHERHTSCGNTLEAESITNLIKHNPS
jgi:hypothetical protein